MQQREPDDGEAAEHRVGAEPGEGPAFAVPVGVQRETGGGQSKGGSDAEGRHEGAEGGWPSPSGHATAACPPCRGIRSHGAEDEGHQDQQQWQVERGEQGGVPEGEGRERGAGGGQEPHLIAVPDRADRVEQHAAFGVVPGEALHQHSNTEVKALQKEVARPQHRDGDEPDGGRSSMLSILCVSLGAKA